MEKKTGTEADPEGSAGLLGMGPQRRRFVSLSLCGAPNLVSDAARDAALHVTEASPSRLDSDSRSN